MSRRWLSTAVISTALIASTVYAMTNGVISAFKGQLVLSKDELPEGKNDKDTINKIRGAQLKELKGEPHGDVSAWSFHYTAFLTKTGATHLKMEFLKDGRLSADKQLDGVDPKNGVLAGDITIDEDEGVAKGKTYTIELAAGSTVVAKTTVTLN